MRAARCPAMLASVWSRFPLAPVVVSRDYLIPRFQAPDPGRSMSTGRFSLRPRFQHPALPHLAPSSCEMVIQLSLFAL